jgi:hypothetical protein
VPDPTGNSAELVGVVAQDEMEVASGRRQRDGVEVDLHQLELRHRDLGIHDGEQRRRLIGSVAEIGQQVPVVVIYDADRLVLTDGYLRSKHCIGSIATRQSRRRGRSRRSKRWYIIAICRRPSGARSRTRGYSGGCAITG